MIFEIKNRFSGAIIFSMKTESMKLCVSAAIKSGTNLSGADLSGTDLSGTDLSGANLYGANLSRADLSGANLYGADLSRANYGAASMVLGIKQFLGLTWPVIFFDAHIKIGCEMHTTAEWAAFTDDEISKMSSEALKFWQANKVIIMMIAANHQKSAG